MKTHNSLEIFFLRSKSPYASCPPQRLSWPQFKRPNYDVSIFHSLDYFGKWKIRKPKYDSDIYSNTTAVSLFALRLRQSLHCGSVWPLCRCVIQPIHGVVPRERTPKQHKSGRWLHQRGWAVRSKKYWFRPRSRPHEADTDFSYT
jgi:hypothetical protein